MFTPFKLRGLVLANRVGVSPMCQYSADDGIAVRLAPRASRQPRARRRRPGDGRDDRRRSRRAHHARMRRAVSARARAGVAAHRRLRAPVLAGEDRHAARRTRAARARPSCRGRAAARCRRRRRGRSSAPSPLPFRAGDQVPREMTRGRHGDGARRVRALGEVGRRRRLRSRRAARGARLPARQLPVAAVNRRGDAYGGSVERACASRSRWSTRCARRARRDAAVGAHLGHRTGRRAAPRTTTSSRSRARSHARGADIIDVSAGGTVARGGARQAAGSTRRRSPSACASTPACRR